MTREELLIAYGELIHNKTNGLVVNVDAFDDATQEVGLHIVEATDEEIASIKDAKNTLLTWFDRSCKKLKRKEIMSKFVSSSYAHAQFPCLEDEDKPVLTPSVHSDLYNELRELRDRAVQWALQRIPLRHRQLLEYVGAGGSVRQYGISQLMEYNAAKQLHHRAKKSLRLQLETAKVPDDLLRLGESDRMSSCLLQWLLTGPHSAEILYTVIDSERHSLVPYNEIPEGPAEFEEDHSDSIDRSSADEDIPLMVLQSEGEYEDDLS